MLKNVRKDIHIYTLSIEATILIIFHDTFSQMKSEISPFNLWTNSFLSLCTIK